jgi:hypothetical protein
MNYSQWHPELQRLARWLLASLIASRLAYLPIILFGVWQQHMTKPLDALFGLGYGVLMYALHKMGKAGWAVLAILLLGYFGAFLVVTGLGNWIYAWPLVLYLAGFIAMSHWIYAELSAVTQKLEHVES